MPLTLDEIKSLIAALGIKIPEEILAQKAKAEEFKVRRQQVTAEAGVKPAYWWLKAKFDDTLKHASAAADQKQLDSALKLLDEAGQLLQQPDAPAAPVASAESAAPHPSAAKPGVAFNEKEFQRQWAAAKKVWIECLETVDDQLNKVRAKMLASGDPEFKIIADRGLPALTDNHKTPVMKAVFELNGPPGDARRSAALRAKASIVAFRTHLNSYHLIGSLDEHSKAAFGVSMALRAEIGKGLSVLEEAIQPVLAS